MIDPAERSDYARLDAQDALAARRDAFRLQPGRIYLDGNSLGVPTEAALAALRTAAETEWGEALIGAWNSADWIGLPRRLGDRIGRLVGAEPGTTIVCDSISVNLFKLLAAALALRPGRRTILSSADNFPTDLYMTEGLRDLVGGERCRLRLLDGAALDVGGRSAEAVAATIAEAVDDDTALVMLTQVNFRTGEMLDMAAVTRAVQARGALMLWDLAHSAGAVPVDLQACGADMAVGCGYKYLGGGPGAPAFLQLASRHIAAAEQPLRGWMGHARPFAFETDYAPAEGIERFLSGTPSVLGSRALEGALDVFDGIDMHAVRAKSLALSQALIDLVERSAVADDLELASPRAAERRGSQVSFRHPQAFELTQALIAEGVVGDFRAPDLLRLGITPLYLRFVDVFDAVRAIEAILTSGRHRDPRFAVRARVT